MRHKRMALLCTVAAALLLCCEPRINAQQSAQATSPSARSSAHPPDLSGNWLVKSGSPSWDSSDPRGENPEHLAMTPWALERMRAARPPFGAQQTFEPNDPHQKYCDPPGPFRMYSYPWQFTIVQTPSQVYLMFEYLHIWRIVAMNQQHAKDLDATWLGDSVGRYEGDTLVIDTVGFNDKTWLDNVGHPHSDALHTVERFRRLDHDTLQLEITFEDPKAYAHSFSAMRTFKLSKFPMGETMCSLSEDQSFQKGVMDPTVAPESAK